MKILLISLGTRGDIEPFLAQAEILSAKGHEITCLFPAQFESLVKNLGYQFRAFDKRFLMLLESQSGKKVMGGGSGWGQFKGYLQLVRDSFSLQGLIIEQQRSAILEIKPDRTIFHTKAMYCYLAAMMQPDKFLLLSPIPCIGHPCYDYPHIGLAKWTFSKKWNFKSYSLINGIRRRIMKRYWKKYQEDFKKPGVKIQDLKAFEIQQLQTLYTISPQLFPKPSTWPSAAHLTGFYQRNQQKDYKAAPDLLDWIKTHPKPILVTFGSMSNPKPLEHTQLIIDCLVRHKIPAIINLSWGGLSRIETAAESIYFVEQIPYDWVLAQMYGMIHHGGSGTTHLGAVSGCSQLVIPHIIDQYFWNRLVADRGLGPLGISIHRLNAADFEKLLRDFYTNLAYKKNALEMAEKIKYESNPSEIVQLIEG